MAVAGLGMAVAARLDTIDRNVVAVIGDGAMSAGMAYEAMNNTGALRARLVVILNDNDMSIAPPTGAMSAYLSRVVSSHTYRGFRHVAKQLSEYLPSRLQTVASRAEVSVMGELMLGGRKRTVSGMVDRLAVTEDAVAILDYKTNRPAPASRAEVPPAHVLQLALYAAMLKPLWPGRRISAALLYTEAPRLIALPESELAAALARLTPA